MGRSLNFVKSGFCAFVTFYYRDAAQQRIGGLSRKSKASNTRSPRTAASAGEVLFSSNLTSLTSPCLDQHSRQPTPYLNPPGIAQPIPFGPRVAWVQHVLMGAGDPCAAADFGDDGGAVTDLGGVDNPARKG